MPSKPKNICSEPYCRNKAHGKMCASCRCRKSREADPVRYAYNNIKNRAKQRGKPFTITLEYFREFCVKYEYIKNKGTTMQSYTVDCIVAEKGYVPGNIQALTKEKNIRKYLEYDWMYRTAVVKVWGTPAATEWGG